jgi:hypothetical protein
MKTNAVVLIVSAGVGAALVGVGACSSMMGNKPKKVVIEDDRIFIPGTAITEDDRESVKAILKQYKKSLYKIQTYESGHPSGKANGTLADKIIGEATVAQVASDAKQNALSGWGFQIGNSSHPSVQPSPTPQPSGSPSHPSTVPSAVPGGSPSHPSTVPPPVPGGSPSHPSTVETAAAHPNRQPNPDEEASRELVAKVAPILRKYSQ